MRRLFVLFEVCLLVAIPALAYTGFRTLLDTRTGTFIDDPGPDSPGWVALVDPSPVVGIVEMDGETLAGVAVAVNIGQTTRGGAVLLVPAELRTETGQPIGTLTPTDAIAAISSTLDLRIPVVEVVDTARWERLLAGASYALPNPDPVPGDSGEVLFEVGTVEVNGSGVSAFLGRTVQGADSRAALVRRDLFWTEMLTSPPPETDDPLSRTIRAIAEGPHEVVRLPTEPGADGGPVPRAGEVDRLVRRIVAFPAGAEADRRFRVRVEDRTGTADLDAVARVLGGMGIEVVAISNGAVFDDAGTALRVEPGFARVEELAEQFPGVRIETSQGSAPTDEVVLQLGPGYDDVLAGLS